MTWTVSAREVGLNIVDPTNFVEARVGQSTTFSDIVDWSLANADAEDAADANETLTIYEARGLADFVRIA